MKKLLDHALVDEPVQVPRPVPSIGKLDHIDLPIVTPVRASMPVRDEKLDQSDTMDEITDLALAKAKEILELPLEIGDDDFPTVLRAQVAQVQTVLTTQVRVDEGRFKKKQVDRLGELLDLIRGEEMKMIPGRVLN